MTDKIIIHNYTDLDDCKLMLYVANVIKAGKISKTKQGEQYCFASSMCQGIMIYSLRKGNTYTFKVLKENEYEKI